MKKLLIDSNAYLSFYKMASDDLEELRKLTAMIVSSEIDLYLTDQINDEVLRNREDILAQSLKVAKDLHLPTSFPQIIRNYSRFVDLDSARKDFAKHLAILISQVTDDAVANRLHADVLLRGLFSSSTFILSDDDVIGRARLRVARGNPPGKGGSFGDAITWEAVLAHHPKGEDLFLITGDGDFLSPLAQDRLHEFLSNEWKDLMDSRVFVYRNMSAFFKEHYPTIELSDEVEIELAVSRLVASRGFTDTHAVMAILSQQADFTKSQVTAIAEAAVSNTQIRWIMTDSDVHDFYTRFVRNHRDSIDTSICGQIEQLLEPEVE